MFSWASGPSHILFLLPGIPSIQLSCLAHSGHPLEHRSRSISLWHSGHHAQWGACPCLATVLTGCHLFSHLSYTRFSGELGSSDALVPLTQVLVISSRDVGRHLHSRPHCFKTSPTPLFPASWVVSLKRVILPYFSLKIFYCSSLLKLSDPQSYKVLANLTPNFSSAIFLHHFKLYSPCHSQGFPKGLKNVSPLPWLMRFPPPYLAGKS